MPATLELVLSAMVFGSVVGVFIGIVAAHWRNGPIDHGARLIALIGSSAPVFWSGLIALYIFSGRFSWLPGAGRLDPALSPPETVTGLYTIDALAPGDWSLFKNAVPHLVLPTVILGWAVLGIISRMIRASMLDVCGRTSSPPRGPRGPGPCGCCCATRCATHWRPPRPSSAFRLPP